MSKPQIPTPEASGNYWDRAFWRKVKVAGPDECWLWQGSLNSSGYGLFVFEGFWFRAHRFAWETTNGPIFDGKWVLHKCDVRRCCNPAHLYLGDHQDNMNDMKERKRHGDQKGKAATPVPWTKANKKVREAARRLREG